VLVLALAAHAQIRFEDTAVKSGLKFELRNGAAGKFHQPELMLGGVAVLDFDEPAERGKDVARLLTF